MRRMQQSTGKTNKTDRNRAALMIKVSKAGFMLGDLHLYLDTHPTDMYALKHYEYYQNKYNTLKREYESRYGPLTPKLPAGADRWSWIDGPWPWENEFNEE